MRNRTQIVGRQDVAIVEKLVRVDSTFEELSFEGVPDVRLIVFRGYPVMSMLRLATRASDGKANLIRAPSASVSTSRRDAAYRPCSTTARSSDIRTPTHP